MNKKKVIGRPQDTETDGVARSRVAVLSRLRMRTVLQALIDTTGG